MTDDAFADLLENNKAFAADFKYNGIPGTAQARVAIVTCMDCRIDPHRALGLDIGDMKVMRNPGGRVDDITMEALILSVQLLNCNRIIIAPHTRCAMGSATLEEFRSRISEASGQNADWLAIHAVSDPEAALRDDVLRVRSHPLIGDDIAVGGFFYDVDSGLLNRVL